MAEREPLLAANMTTLSICYQQLSAQINRLLEPLKLNMTQLSILSHFSRMAADHKETVTHLSQVMEMKQPMVTKAVKALHTQGFILRRAGTTDARVSYLSISELGRTHLKEAYRTCLPSLDEAFTDLSIEELTQLITLLSKVKNRIV